MLEAQQYLVQKRDFSAMHLIFVLQLSPARLVPCLELDAFPRAPDEQEFEVDAARQDLGIETSLVMVWLH